MVSRTSSMLRQSELPDGSREVTSTPFRLGSKKDKMAPKSFALKVFCCPSHALKDAFKRSRTFSKCCAELCGATPTTAKSASHLACSCCVGATSSRAAPGARDAATQLAPSTPLWMAERSLLPMTGSDTGSAAKPNACGDSRIKDSASLGTTRRPTPSSGTTPRCILCAKGSSSPHTRKTLKWWPANSLAKCCIKNACNLSATTWGGV
mmetsp:Transcript_9265/g.16694  ORF Transcript_9265/g.16694 Transcript_9265/m.16694 type:complete len:208 (-) Transcript_9265:1141-1764(-)